MTAIDLLPSNATRLERDLSRTVDVLPRLGPGAELVRTGKRANIPDDVVPWLIYEYGLGEITPLRAGPSAGARRGSAVATGQRHPASRNHRTGLDRFRR